MKWNDTQVRAALEAAVANFRGRAWHIRSITDLSEFACHPCGIFSDGEVGIFAKFSEAFDAAKQFEIELDDLQYLASRAGVMVPNPVGVVPAANGVLFISEAQAAVERGPRQWRQMGAALARIHRINSDRCGFLHDNYFGPLVQENTPIREWSIFYERHRLSPRLKAAVDSGNLPPAVASQMEKVIARLPQLCGPDPTPSLLHGDAQQNNFISTEKGAVIIDPAVYYGHPEMDLAFIDYFQPVPADFFLGYREELPIDPGFRDRRDLWRIAGYLAAIEVEGPAHIPRLTDALRRYA
ncbi:MAG: fructosamine kinase family protein [Anaerolineales bacterium]|nr:fructosamine kinase family protein [Anaerolineales bacterium]